MNNIYFADYNSWFDPLYRTFSRSVVGFLKCFINAKIVLNNMKVHTDSIGITFEFQDVSSLFINNFEYNSTKAMAVYGKLFFYL